VEFIELNAVLDASHTWGVRAGSILSLPRLTVGPRSSNEHHKRNVEGLLKGDRSYGKIELVKESKDR
jgi:hypothetical protein